MWREPPTWVTRVEILAALFLLSVIVAALLGGWEPLAVLIVFGWLLLFLATLAGGWLVIALLLSLLWRFVTGAPGLKPSQEQLQQEAKGALGGSPGNATETAGTQPAFWETLLKVPLVLVVVFLALLVKVFALALSIPTRAWKAIRHQDGMPR